MALCLCLCCRAGVASAYSANLETHRSSSDDITAPLARAMMAVDAVVSVAGIPSDSVLAMLFDAPKVRVP